MRNSDYLILLIKTFNAHKERTLSQTIINILKSVKGVFETQLKMMVEAKCWLSSKIQK